MHKQRCTKCGEEKPLEDFWPKRRSEPEKRHGRCRVCMTAERKAWAERNPDVIADYARRYRAKDPERERERARRYRETNPNKVKASKQREYDENADAYKAKSAEWRRQNPDRNRELIEAWKAAHPLDVSDMRKRMLAKRRARLHDVFIEDVQPLVVLEASDGVCGICGEDVDPVSFEMDHVIPISRGGRHAYDNVQPAHPVCNRRKGAML